MNIKESYIAFLDQNGAKEKMQKIISEQIEEWKKQPYYEYEPGEDEFGDCSGRVNRIPGKTIGDMFTAEGRILTAYSGNSETSMIPHCGLLYKTVAQEISWYITDEFNNLRREWFEQNYVEVLAALNIKRKDTWDEETLFIEVKEAMGDEYYEEEWFAKNFPQYCLDEDSNPNGNPNDLVFWISL